MEQRILTGGLDGALDLRCQPLEPAYRDEALDRLGGLRRS